MCDIQNGYAFKSEKLVDDYKTGLIPVIKIGNLISKGGIDLSKIKYHQYSDSLEKFIVNEGSILIAMTGATVGKVSVVDSGKYLLNQRVGLLEEGNEVLKKYITILLQSDDFYKYCQTNAGGGAQGNISPAQIGNYQIPLPPLEKQQEIVDEIEQYQKEIHKAEQAIVDSNKKIEEAVLKIYKE